MAAVRPAPAAGGADLSPTSLACGPDDSQDAGPYTLIYATLRDRPRIVVQSNLQVVFFSNAGGISQPGDDQLGGNAFASSASCGTQIHFTSHRSVAIDSAFTVRNVVWFSKRMSGTKLFRLQVENVCCMLVHPEGVL